MRVDHDKREIVCSVGDLVYPTTVRRIGVERGDGFRRMWIGQEIHSRRAVSLCRVAAYCRHEEVKDRRHFTT